MSDQIQEKDEPDINLLDLLIALGQEKWTLILVTFLAAAYGVVVSYTTPATYVARTVVMASQQSGGVGAAAMGGLSGLSGMAGMPNLGAGIQTSDELYIALMRSQSVQSVLIDKLKLKERYGSKNLEEARQSLTQSVAIVVDRKSGLLLIDAEDGDPEFAAQLANAQVNELIAILNRLGITQAQQRVAYFEQQVLKTQANIPQLEAEFKQAQKSSGIEIASLLSESGTLPSQIAAKELQLQVLSRFATGQNPEIKRLSTEISALRAQLVKYELSKSFNKKTEDAKSGSIAPDSKTTYVQKATQAFNTLKIQESLLDAFVKQLEVAKVEAGRESSSVQIVDFAQAPEMRNKPQRKKLVIAYTTTGLILAVALAAIKALLRHIKSTSDGRERWLQIKRAWGFV
jgi:tyrosine-protein kinase Etk/Wzc